MRALIWIGFVSLAATAAFAQRPTVPAPAHGATSAAPAHPVPPRRPAGFYGYSGLPLYYDGSDYGYAPPTPPVMPPLPPYVAVPEPPPVVHPEVHEYKQTSANEPVAVQEPPAFALALRDGSVHFAAAVSVQDDGLHYVDIDGRHETVALNALDRETTQRLNQERKLKLHLPVPAK